MQETDEHGEAYDDDDCCDDVNVSECKQSTNEEAFTDNTKKWPCLHFWSRMFADGERHFVALDLLFVSTTGACHCARSWVVNELLEYNEK